MCTSFANRSWLTTHSLFPLFSFANCFFFHEWTNESTIPTIRCRNIFSSHQENERRKDRTRGEHFKMYAGSWHGMTVTNQHRLITNLRPPLLYIRNTVNPLSLTNAPSFILFLLHPLSNERSNKVSVNTCARSRIWTVLDDSTNPLLLTTHCFLSKPFPLFHEQMNQPTNQAKQHKEREQKNLEVSVKMCVSSGRGM